MLIGVSALRIRKIQSCSKKWAKVFARVKLMHCLCKSEDKLCDRERHSFANLKVQPSQAILFSRCRAK